MMPNVENFDKSTLFAFPSIHSLSSSQLDTDRLYFLNNLTTSPPTCPVIIKGGGLFTLQASRKGQTGQVSRSVFGKAQFLLSIKRFSKSKNLRFEDHTLRFPCL